VSAIDNPPEGSRVGIVLLARLRLELNQSREVSACALHREYSQRREGGRQYTGDDHEGYEQAVIDHDAKHDRQTEDHAIPDVSLGNFTAADDPQCGLRPDQASASHAEVLCPS
jgi:hypothetical protein